MDYEGSLKELYSTAAEVEGMEGTVSYSYTSDKEDAYNYTSAAKKKFLIIIIFTLAASAILIVLGIVAPEHILTGIGISTFVIMGCVAFVFFSNMRKIKKNGSGQVDEVKLSFNIYGVVMRVCSRLRNGVYVYKWNDFDSLIEYDKVIVGIKEGLAFIFPKRIIVGEDLEKFRRFSLAGAGKKCVYKKR